MANGGRKGSPAVVPFAAGAVQTLADISGPGCIRHIWITTPPDRPLHDRNLILRAYWDGQPQPSIECPLGDFFGMAHGRRRSYFSALNSMPEGRGLNCYYEMPFRTHARLTLENDCGEDVSALFYQIDYTIGDALTEECGYLHTQFRRENPTTLMRDYAILDGVRGRGSFLGCVLGVRALGDHWWGEGEFKFYLDDDTEYPTICGTGLEDYAGSAWGIGEHAALYSGCPLYERRLEPHNDALISLYRWHTPDPIYFHEDLRVTVQQIGGAPIEAVRDRLQRGELRPTHPVNAGTAFVLYERQDDYSSAAFWYQTLPTAPFPPLPDRSLRSAGL